MAFSGCISLSSLSIPNSVTKVADAAFLDNDPSFCISTSSSISTTKFDKYALLGTGMCPIYQPSRAEKTNPFGKETVALIALAMALVVITFVAVLACYLWKAWKVDAANIIVEGEIMEVEFNIRENNPARSGKSSFRGIVDESMSLMHVSIQ
jgi:hypothetical protein